MALLSLVVLIYENDNEIEKCWSWLFFNFFYSEQFNYFNPLTKKNRRKKKELILESKIYISPL